MDIEDTGAPISVPVGNGTLGRLFNVLGDTIDDRGPAESDERWPIHRDAPSFEELQPTAEIFETGIKVIDLLAPYVKGGKVGLFGGAGVGKTSSRSSSAASRRSMKASPCSPAWASARVRATISGSR